MKGINFLLLAFLFSCSHRDPMASHPIQGPLNARYESYRQCYLESEIYRGRKNPPPGQMEIEFVIKPDGKVSTARIKESNMPKDPNFEVCVIGQIKAIHFPAVKTETHVSQPINFLPVAPL